jgi:enolase
VVGEGLGGVEAVIETNISKFSGYVSYPAKTYSKENLILRDFTGIQEVVRGHLRRLDPFNLPEFDNVLSKIPGLDTTISLALSMACCRASARHKAIPLYKFIAEIAGTYDKMKIPTPVVSVLNCTPDIDLPARQEISLIATSSTTLDNALEALLRASLHIREKLSTSSQMTITMMDGGCPCVVVPTLSQAAQVSSTSHQQKAEC